MKIFDLGVIGGGPAGYTTALYAAQKGQSVILFEKDDIGGTCLNRGCIPTKILLHAAEVYEEIKNADKIGISVDNVTPDFQKISEYKDKTVAKLRKSLELSIKQAGITVVKSNAAIKNEHTILAENQEFECKKIVIATGSNPREIKGLEFDHEFILSSDDVLNFTQLPEKMLIVGSGAIGIEFARLLSTFGVDITIIELADRLTPLADWEVSKRIERQFKLAKIKYYTSCGIKVVDKQIHQVELTNEEIIETDCILVAAGRGVNAGVNAGVNTGITQLPIIGDASSEIMLAHYAVSQAKQLVLDIPFNKGIIPSVIYGSPEIAWVGKTFKSKEEEEGYDIVVFPISALGKAHADNSIDGFIKIISKNGLIEGASIISKEASSLIQQIVITMGNNITVEKLKEVCFAHPTYSEGIMEGIMRL